MKARGDNASLDLVNWDAVDQAMKESPRQRKVFVAKHSVGMFGVGIFIKIWKERDSDACPRCGTFEDARHMWTCSGEGADEVWAQSIYDLEEWMTSIGADPEISHAIVMHLTVWKTQQEAHTVPSLNISDLVDQQEVIGWRNFFEGWMSSTYGRRRTTYTMCLWNLDLWGKDGPSL